MRTTHSHINCKATFGLGVCVWHLAFFFSFFFFFGTRLWDLRLLFMHCSMNSSYKVWLFYFFQPISTHCALFMDPQILLFSNFFIKNRSHGTIYTFKNYFATVFFSFQFQFLVFSCIQTDSYGNYPMWVTILLPHEFSNKMC